MSYSDDNSYQVSDPIIAALQQAVLGILPPTTPARPMLDKTDDPPAGDLDRSETMDDMSVQCRRICTGPPDQMVCAVQCSINQHPAVQKQHVVTVKQRRKDFRFENNDMEGRRYLLLQSSLLYLTHLEMIISWPNMYDYEQVLFCVARFINTLSDSQVSDPVMGRDLEQIHALHECESEFGNRSVNGFHTCVVAKFKTMFRTLGEAEREAEILTNDFVQHPSKYRMILCQKQFMYRLEDVSLSVLEKFAQAAWYHPETSSDMKKHCVGKNNPYTIHESHLMRGNALIIPTGIDMEYKIRESERHALASIGVVISAYPETLGCNLQYRIILAEDELEKQQQQQSTSSRPVLTTSVTSHEIFQNAELGEHGHHILRDVMNSYV